jgi:hypothetical protein
MTQSGHWQSFAIGQDFDPPQIKAFLERANLDNAAHEGWPRADSVAAVLAEAEQRAVTSRYRGYYAYLPCY